MARVRIGALLSAFVLSLAFGFASASAGDKVEVFHKGKKVICVSVNAVPAHLAHGDTTDMEPC